MCAEWGFRGTGRCLVASGEQAAGAGRASPRRARVALAQPSGLCVSLCEGLVFDVRQGDSLSQGSPVFSLSSSPLLSFD